MILQTSLKEQGELSMDDLSRWYSPGAAFVTIILAALVIMAVVALVKRAREEKSLSTMTPAQQTAYQREKMRRAAERQRQASEASAQLRFGPVNPALICPHCQAKGKVRTNGVKKKVGISGGKAAAAVLTGGLSVVAVGLSRKEGLTQARCDNCDSIWHF
jgi:uncharacterized membrane protein